VAAADSPLVSPGESAPSPLAEGTKTLDGLLEAFRKSPGVSARFTEEKHISLLKKPLKSEGALYFMAPDKLARHTEKPKRSVILLEGNDLRISDGKGVRTVDLAKNAAVAALVRSFVHLLRGDRAVLEKDFKVDFTDRGGSWLLELTPKTAPLSNLVTAIRVTGQGLVLSDMTVAEPNGDSTVTRFSEVNTARRFTEAEKKQLFSP
jgi:outer membrane lipoprotein-sorting protein